MARRILFSVVMVAVMVLGSLAIPSRVANRMIPSWWINARTKKTCQFWSDCGPGECCVRPMLASNSYCLPYKSRGQTCDASALLVNVEKEVFFDHCPCESSLTCANIDAHSVCVDPEVLDNLTVRPSPLPIKL
ncbi:prokineticin Bm8-d-like [Panulirus ornatus]|uniref:prokineticin Bm8-d-like n=1 Tax=Panulirus ornatus TaxID=150431 RepID=UPI003A8C5FA7